MTTASIQKTNTRICLYCGVKFTPNHGNRKHCNDECKIDYSNARGKQRRQRGAIIDGKLKSNLTILERLIGDQTEITRSVEFMRGTGFDFNCHTHWVEYDGKQSRCIYDFIIVMINPQTVKIIKNV